MLDHLDSETNLEFVIGGPNSHEILGVTTTSRLFETQFHVHNMPNLKNSGATCTLPFYLNWYSNWDIAEATGLVNLGYDI